MAPCMTKRLANVGRWLLFWSESLIFIFVPSAIALPFSTCYLMDCEDFDFNTLSLNERHAVYSHVLVTGLASFSAFFAFAFGLFGKYGPADVYKRDGDNPLSIIVQQRKGNSCCICLEEFELEHDVKVLKCKHCYHSECLKKWKEKRSCCPLCRGNVSTTF